jgi:hypothetical protein
MIKNSSIFLGGTHTRHTLLSVVIGVTELHYSIVYQGWYTLWHTLLSVVIGVTLLVYHIYHIYIYILYKIESTNKGGIVNNNKYIYKELRGVVHRYISSETLAIIEKSVNQRVVHSGTQWYTVKDR